LEIVFVVQPGYPSNGGGSWGEVINGGFVWFLMVVKKHQNAYSSMLFWDVNNGISRRSWAVTKAHFALKGQWEATIIKRPSLI
jgi:urocanate hydratase